METIFLIIILIALVVIIIKLNTINEKTSKNAQKINKHVVMVYRKIETLESNLAEKGDKLKNVTNLKKEIETIHKPLEEKKPTNVIKPPVLESDKVSELQGNNKETLKNTQAIGTIVNGRKKIAEGKWVDVESVKKETVSKSKILKPKKNKTDWEKLIGENLLNKIGIAILVLGIGFFVKYAIDQNWIGEYGRVAIGIGIGAILIIIAHFMRKNFKTFSSVLIGGGIGVFYYTISIAYQDYLIFSQPVAFTIMTIITISAVTLSVLYNKKEIAVIGLIGGFTSPFMVQGETDNYVAFFTYIAILNSGMLALSYYKKWNIIIKLAYGFTILFFGAWLIVRLFDFNPMPHKFAFLISLIYYFQFLGMSLAYNIKQKLKFNAFEFIQILSVNAMFFLAGILILRDFKNGSYQGLFTLFLAGFNFMIYILLYKKESIDKNLKQVFIGKTVSFVTLAILLQFNTHFASLFWAIESVIILWLAQRNKQYILKQASLIITIVATIGLIFSWIYQLNHSVYKSIINPYLLSGIGVIISYILNIFLLNKEKKETIIFVFPAYLYKNALAFWAYIAFYITLLIVFITHKTHFGIIPNLENNDFMINYENYAFYRLILWGYTLLIIAIGFFFVKIKKINLFREIFSVLAVLSVIAFVLYGNSNTIQLRDVVLNNHLSSFYYYLHFLVIGIIIFILYVFRKISFEIFKDSKFNEWAIVILSVLGVFIASMELDQVGVFWFYKEGEISIVNILHHTQREGYTTLWGIYSFLLMFYGMRKKNQHIRILALVLFAITLLKLFILDIKDMSDAGKIIAFISLGILLLIVSFLYQKLRKIILGKEVEKHIDEKEN